MRGTAFAGSSIYFLQVLLILSLPSIPTAAPCSPLPLRTHRSRPVLASVTLSVTTRPSPSLAAQPSVPCRRPVAAFHP